MTNLPPPAEELRLLDAELWHLDARRAVLLRRRAWLLDTLRAASAAGGGRVHGTVPPVWPVRDAAAHRPETTAPGVQNVLLVLGGVLLTVAAIAFTLVGWGHMGIVGRSLVLGAVTVGALGAPVLLLRRGLESTAEAVACLGLALTVLDAYALREVVWTGTDAPTYAAAASALLAGAWAAYGPAVSALVPAAAHGDGDGNADQDGARGEDGTGAEGRGPGRAVLRLPLPLATATAHLPLLLWALAAGAGAHTVTAALLATAAAGTAVALRAPALPVRIVAVVGSLCTGVVGVVSAGLLGWSADGPGTAARSAVLLVLAAAVALVAARSVRESGVAVAAATAAGLCAVAGAGGVLRASLPGVWTVPGYLVCGAALLAAVRTPLDRASRRGLVLASLAVQGLAVLWSVPLVAGTLIGPVTGLERPWSGVPRDFRAAVFQDVPWPPDAATVPLVLAIVAGALTVVARRRAQEWPLAAVGAIVSGWATLLVLPGVLELPYGAGLVAQGALVVAALGGAERARRAAGGTSPLMLTAMVLALVTSVALVLVSLASEPVTIGVLVAATLGFGAAAARPGFGPFAAPAAFVHATALACAIGASAGWQPPQTALLVLLVPAVAALVAARPVGRATAVSVEGAGAAAGLLALALAATDPPMLALVLSLCGLVAAGAAFRPDRRPAAHVAAVLLLLATWVRWAAWDVTTPEAYTLPVTVPALVVGFLRRRRDPDLSSWPAYGAGLAVTAVPSLLMTWGDPHWLRPLLLGTAALAVTLAGARHRLQAPLVLGGTVLALVALHELAPYAAQVVGALPRWAPPALAGLVLLALGATYEQRLRDARRVREALGRLH
ncbi:SCO7613 C-terminal domain-containing membrane protein [Streptomyces sp. NPDC016675]|uniref:SCO7613 C-terminal domain-containing membrane protein n=1 Tax=Streptomyces sp. NPDC016675 TaxID=3364970 RepID=UPI0037017CC9